MVNGIVPEKRSLDRMWRELKSAAPLRLGQKEAPNFDKEIEQQERQIREGICFLKCSAFSQTDSTTATTNITTAIIVPKQISSNRKCTSPTHILLIHNLLLLIQNQPYYLNCLLK